MANAVVIGNLLGRGEKSQAFKGGIVTALLGVAMVSLLMLIVVANARLIAGWLSRDPVVVEETIRYIYISMVFEPVMAWGVILGGGLNGAGDTRSVMMSIAVSIWGVRIPLSFITAIWWGYGAAAVWWSMNASLLVQSFLITRQYLSRKWIPAS